MSRFKARTLARGQTDGNRVLRLNFEHKHIKTHHTRAAYSQFVAFFTGTTLAQEYLPRGTIGRVDLPLALNTICSTNGWLGFRLDFGKQCATTKCNDWSESYRPHD